PLDAAVDCYGAFVVGEVPPELPLDARPIVGMTPSLSCPLLGLFGAEDAHPSPDETPVLQKALADSGKVFELHTYEGAGHAFFSVDRPSYRPEAANDGWRRIEGWFRRYLAA
ncbi:MAG: dienelactone hydrolase family protein, partial [Acidimicrobiales bacterium]